MKIYTRRHFGEEKARRANTAGMNKKKLYFFINPLPFHSAEQERLKYQEKKKQVRG